jgi:hypothetical protein
MSCLRIETSPVTLPSDAGVAGALEVRRAQAIASLVADERWVGIPSNPPANPALTAVDVFKEDNATSVLIPRPQAA